MTEINAAAVIQNGTMSPFIKPIEYRHYSTTIRYNQVGCLIARFYGKMAQMEASIFSQLILVLVIAAGIALLARLFKQPLIMGYIITGVIVGPSVLNLVNQKEAFESFSQIGITLLLFIIGLGMNPAVIKGLGRPVFTTAAAILVMVGSVGITASYLLGFAPTEAAIMGLALFFSSTIIILKVISDKQQLSRLYAQLSIGIIVIDDVVATLALVVVAATSTAGGLVLSQFGWLALKGLGLALVLYLVGSKVVPWISRAFADAQETLYLFTIAWGLGVAAVFSLAGFSFEVGALFAGVALAPLPYATQMAARLKPLRDFFVVLFFVHLGETFSFDHVSASLIPALILSVIVLIGKPVFVMISLGSLGYTRMTSFKAGIHLSQISEFSIVLLVFANSVGLVSSHALSTITLVALITIGASTYLMKFDDQLYARIHNYLRIFERRNPHEKPLKVVHYTMMLFGYHKGGYEFVSAFQHLKARYLVVDYDPSVTESLANQGIRHAYGDATDVEFLEEINAAKSELVVSTISDMSTNQALIEYLHHHNPDLIFICHAESYDNAVELYQYGASYVILPHLIGSQQASKYIKQHGVDKAALLKYRRQHLADLGRLDLADI